MSRRQTTHSPSRATRPASRFVPSLALAAVASFGLVAASSDSLFASTTVQEVTTTVRGPIHEWRILADGTVLLRMNVTEAKEGLKGTRWLRTLPDRTDKPSFESLVMESIILCPHGGEHGHPPFYAQVRAERGQLGESAERPMMIQALGRVRVDHESESDAEGQ